MMAKYKGRFEIKFYFDNENAKENYKYFLSQKNKEIIINGKIYYISDITLDYVVLVEKCQSEHEIETGNKIISSIENKGTFRQVVYAKWILHKNGNATCDRCNRTQKNVWNYNNFQNYCGCCGAKMIDTEADNNGKKRIFSIL